MAEAQLQQFLEKVRQLNAFVALSEAQPNLRQALRQCNQHHEVVALAARFGFDIGRRWGDATPPPPQPAGEPEAAEEGGAPPAQDQPNLLGGACPPPGEERIETLLSGPQWRLERIHSCLAHSADGFWYDQREWEWVLVLRGSARLQFADEQRERDLCVGDSLLITPHRRHRVVATDPDPGTLWLALFWSADE
ncbi:MAG: Nif11 domain/cupin domain-containing protein [Vulcanococcus sp.]|jgi:cupin 2 domain-containing protein